MYTLTRVVTTSATGLVVATNVTQLVNELVKSGRRDLAEILVLIDTAGRMVPPA